MWSRHGAAIKEHAGSKTLSESRRWVVPENPAGIACIDLDLTIERPSVAIDVDYRTAFADYRLDQHLLSDIERGSLEQSMREARKPRAICHQDVFQIAFFNNLLIRSAAEIESFSSCND